MRAGRPRFLLGLVVLLWFAGCGGDRDAGPPVMHYGEDVCVRCNMIISEERFAAAAIVEEVDGRWRPVKFDDIGCLLAYLAERPTDRVVASYVHDVEDLEWIRADEAVYSHDPELLTPMLSGISARRDPDPSQPKEEWIEFESLRASPELYAPQRLDRR